MLSQGDRSGNSKYKGGNRKPFGVAGAQSSAQTVGRTGAGGKQESHHEGADGQG